MDGVFRIHTGASGPADVIIGVLTSATPGVSFSDATDPVLICRTPEGVTPEREETLPGVILAQDESSCTFEVQFDGSLVELGDWPAYFQVTAARNGGTPGPVREDSVFTIRVLPEFA